MKSLLASSLLTAALFSACSKAPAPPKSEALAKVGAREILPADFTAEAQRRALAGQPVPEKAALLGEMVLEESALQRALALGLDQDPEVQRTWRSLLIGTLKNRDLDAKLRGVEISAGEIRAQYEANRTAWMLPERARIAMIHGSLPPNVPAEQAAPIRARMSEARALATIDFKQAAARFSEHQGTRYRGGELGWIVRGKAPAQLPPKVAEAAFALDPGAVSEVIQDAGGLYLVTLLEHTASAAMPLAQVEQKIRATLTRDRRAALQREFDESVQRLSGAQLFSDALDRIELPKPARSEPPAYPRTARIP